jgi:hypothetical protein
MTAPNYLNDLKIKFLDEKYLFTIIYKKDWYLNENE